MQPFDDLIAMCLEFKSGDWSVEEFQYRIEAVPLPDECKHTLEGQLYNACNRLEEIIYCYAESQKRYAIEVADELIQATLAERERLKDYVPYLR